MPEETTENTSANTTTDESANNTGASNAGAGTDTALENQAQNEKTFTQAEVDAIIARRLKTAVKSELKKLTGENTDAPNVEELQRQLSEYQTKTRAFETKEAINSFLSDAKNKVAARPENIRAIEKLVLSEIEYDDEGKPSNLKEAIERVKAEAPTLFVTSTGSINGNAGKGNAPAIDWNAQLREAAGYRG